MNLSIGIKFATSLDAAGVRQSVTPYLQKKKAAPKDRLISFLEILRGV